MRFILGIIVTIGVLLVVAIVVVDFGLMSFRADQTPSDFESKYAMKAVDSSTKRGAANLKNPIQPTDLNLLDGMRAYKTYCAGCHGDPAQPKSPLAESFYPPAPQFLSDMPDMPENENFYIIKHGIRFTGMPAWEKLAGDEQIWKVATFLSHMDKLPAAVDQEWKKPAPTNTTAPGN
ncbi:MAG TPA: c-type cytochrome [Candidatus Acidoferrales bacterium]|nr:c-type cytochrome [Candidatus Acidoferrales bacterium]